MRKLGWVLGVAFAVPQVFMVGGCDMVKFTVDQTAPALKRAATSFDAEPDVRLAREAAPGNIKTVDGFLAASPEQRDLLELVAQSYTQYAFGFLEDDLEQLPLDDTPTNAASRKELVSRATGLYDRAYDVALRYIALDDDKIRETMKLPPADLTARLKDETDKDSAPGLYWAGLAMASAINLHRDDVDRVAELPRAIALLERAHELAPEYFHHGAAMALGVIYSSQGKAMGGNPERSKQLFDEVITATGGKYLMARVLYAKFYLPTSLQLVKVSDEEADKDPEGSAKKLEKARTDARAEYEKTLKEVLETPGSVWPEQRLANELALRRAARYFKQADDIF